MTTAPLPETIAELRELLANATPGPWRIVIDDDGNPLSGRPSIEAHPDLDCGIVHWDGFVQTYWRSARGDREIQANAGLIVGAINALPDLLTAAARGVESEAEIARLRAVIEAKEAYGSVDFDPKLCREMALYWMGREREARAALLPPAGDP